MEVLLMVELFKVELEAIRPEIVEVPTVEVEMVEEIMELVPVREVLPPCKERVLPLPFKVVLELTVKVLEPKVKVPLPAVKVRPLMEVKDGVTGKVKVWVEPEEVTLKTEPPVVVAKVWTEPVKPFREVMAPDSNPKEEVETKL